MLEDILNKIIQALGIVADVNLLEKDGKEYIEIVIPAYSASISCKGVYHYRSGSTKQVLTGPALESFLNGKRGVTWDNMPNPAFTMEKVDDSVIEKFKGLAAKKVVLIPLCLTSLKRYCWKNFILLQVNI